MSDAPEGTVVVKAHVEVPAVVEGDRPSDLIAEQMNRQAEQARADAEAHAMAKRFEGVPADRIEEQLQKAATSRRLANLPSWTGRVIAQAAHDAEVAQLAQRFAGLPVDRIAEILQREKDVQDALTAAAHRAGSTPVGAE